MVAKRHERRSWTGQWWTAALLIASTVCIHGCGHPASNGANAPEARAFTIEGMTCEGCANTVTAAIKAIPDVKSADVSLTEKKAIVVADAAKVPTAKIEAVVADAGYKAHLIPSSADVPPQSGK